MNSIQKIIVSTLILLFTLTGCATIQEAYRADPSFMIPERESPALARGERALAIVEVKGAEKPVSQNIFTGNWFNRMSNEEFQNALIKALLHSRLFSEVHSGTAQDKAYRLYVEILSQQEVAPGFGMDTTLFVRYRLLDDSDRELWSKNILSRYETKFSETFDGAKRMKLTREGVVKKNFTELVTELEKVLQDEKER